MLLSILSPETNKDKSRQDEERLSNPYCFWSGDNQLWCEQGINTINISDDEGGNIGVSNWVTLVSIDLGTSYGRVGAVRLP